MVGHRHVLHSLLGILGIGYLWANFEISSISICIPRYSGLNMFDMIVGNAHANVISDNDANTEHNIAPILY
jgi:hypothetical protein